MLCELADERQQTQAVGDGPAPAPERKPRATRLFCPRCGRGPLTGGRCGWCRGTGSRATHGGTPEVGGRELA
jgi:hypothetical protein